MKKDKRIEIVEVGLGKANKALIERAANLCDQSISDFMKYTCTTAALQIIKQEDKQRIFDEAMKTHRESLHNLKNR